MEGLCVDVGGCGDVGDVGGCCEGWCVVLWEMVCLVGVKVETKKDIALLSPESE